jgi:transposase
MTSKHRVEVETRVRAAMINCSAAAIPDGLEATSAASVCSPPSLVPPSIAPTHTSRRSSSNAVPTSSKPSGNQTRASPRSSASKKRDRQLRERLSRNDVEIIELKTVRATALPGLHFTPTYSSWLNLVERFFGYVTADLWQRSDHRSVRALAADIRKWVTAWNEDPKVFVWTKTADQILASLGRLIQRMGIRVTSTPEEKQRGQPAMSRRMRW